MSAANANTIQQLVDQKLALIATINTTLADLLANPKSDYNIDGQVVSWNQYQAMLFKAQKDEGEAVEQLLSLKQKLQPYRLSTRVVVGGW